MSLHHLNGFVLHNNTKWESVKALPFINNLNKERNAKSNKPIRTRTYSTNFFS